MNLQHISAHVHAARSFFPQERKDALQGCLNLAKLVPELATACALAASRLDHLSIGNGMAADQVLADRLRRLADKARAMTKD